MARTKPESKETKPVRVAGASAPRRPAESAEEARRAEFWQDAVASLSARKFANMDEALSAVIDQVLTRLGGPAAVLPGTREFLFDLLDTDPELKGALQSSLSFGR